jgi:uncharacterized surface protein with fasciclin (FAS1) repeats
MILLPITTMSFFMNRSIMALAFLVCLAACTKTDEPTHPVGQQVLYTSAPTRTMGQLLDSLPDCTFFDSAYRHAGMEAYLDTLRVHLGDSSLSYTLFVPTDNAFRTAGYTLQQIGQSSPAVLDSLLFYLTVKGNLLYRNFDSLAGNAHLNTLLQDPTMTRTLPTSFSASNPYQYILYAGVNAGTLWLNGAAVRTAAQSLQGTDGVIWQVDQLVTKPTMETYELLKQDTTYSYYMTALHISDSIYQSSLNFNLRYYFYDTVTLQLRQGSPQMTVLAPTNDAFRRAGFLSPDDLLTYIYSSDCVNHGGINGKNQYLKTNMDSILDLHRIGYAPYSTFNPFVDVVLLRNDMLYNPAVNNMVLWVSSVTNQPSVYTDVNFQNDNGEVTVHRADAPGGAAAHVVTPHDVITLNGAVHRVDNLLTVTP